MNAGEDRLGEFVVASGVGPEMLERVEETLDEIAFAVEGEIARTRGVFRLDLDGMTGAIARSSKALSALKALGETWPALSLTSTGLPRASTSA